MSRLKLPGRARSWQALNETRRTHELSLVEGMEILLQAEQQQRALRRFERLHKNARFRYQASLEELIFDPSRELDKALIASLATGTYIEKGESILVCGSSGTGKSFLISALGAQACAQGYSVAYFNMQKLMVRTRMARIEGTILKFFEKLAKTGLLIMDDLGLTHLDSQQQLDLMEIIEDRHGRASTIMASQLPVASWYDVIGQEPTVSDAILDRLVHTSYRIDLKGDTLRKKR
jgi:DNA replication protein DnaC